MNFAIKDHTRALHNPESTTATNEQKRFYQKRLEKFKLVLERQASFVCKDFSGENKVRLYKGKLPWSYVDCKNKPRKILQMMFPRRLLCTTKAVREISMKLINNSFLSLLFAKFL